MGEELKSLNDGKISRFKTLSKNSASLPATTHVAPLAYGREGGQKVKT
jgi:hypothetical protein